MNRIPEMFFKHMVKEVSGNGRSIRVVENAISPITDYWIGRLAEFYDVSTNNVCCMCGTKIETQIFKNTGTCGEGCRKDRDGDWAPFRGGALSP